jgi:adenine-specific DNA methylase
MTASALPALQQSFDFEEDDVVTSPSGGARAIESEAFPFEALSQIAERESWRKEINRPTYHIHKWWAQRLGSVFRAIALSALTPEEEDVLKLFYSPVRFPNTVVFDPFMGSGTTVGEALKLGCRAVGRDINPVAHFLVRTALAKHDRAKIAQEFRAISNDVAGDIRQYYRTTLADGSAGEVLYFFWVKQLACPSCETRVDLFSKYVFAQHAYPKKVSASKALCPACGEINATTYDARRVDCAGCKATFDPQQGPARGQSACCSGCGHIFRIAEVARRGDGPPSHRMYAKLVLRQDGTKAYERVTPADVELFESAKERLGTRESAFPVVAIQPGHNTNQALGYNYRHWHEMFNERQLLCLSILAERIRSISDEPTRELFACLFSGALEFNNLFASYKGEGTGAVRHMFAHHVLKPERVPLEANLWGTKKSSGSFSTMFDGRIRRAIEYAANPFELSPNDKGAEKVFGLSESLGHRVTKNVQEFEDGERLYLSCGDSSSTDLSNESVDAVITDPPFFDNVHYSELADFFHVWQRFVLGESGERQTTRSNSEVQSPDVGAFTERLSGVLRECYRVLKADGVLAFTYHHSRAEGWSSVLRALMRARFVITATQPIKAEMSVAMPKNQAKEPINIDIIVVCRKADERRQMKSADLQAAWKRAEDQVRRFAEVRRRLSRNDVRVIVMSQLIRELSKSPSEHIALSALNDCEPSVEALITNLHLAAMESLA